MILKEKMTKQKLVAIILCTIGVIICADFSSGSNLASIAFAVAAALSFSLYTVLNKKFIKNLSVVVQTSLSFLAGSIILFLILLVIKVDIIPDMNVTNISILMYLGILVTGIGYCSYFKAMQKGGAMTASFAFFIKPILTPFATFLINGIVPGFKVFAALAFIVTGSFISTYKKKIKKSNKSQMLTIMIDIWLITLYSDTALIGEFETFLTDLPKQEKNKTRGEKSI